MPELRRYKAVVESENKTENVPLLSPVLGSVKKNHLSECLGQTVKRAVRSDVMCDETSHKNKQDHEQLGPRKPSTFHLHLQILGSGKTNAQL